MRFTYPAPARKSGASLSHPVANIAELYADAKAEIWQTGDGSFLLRVTIPGQQFPAVHSNTERSRLVKLAWDRYGLKL
jgi:hypothetical protein